jgi:hypothetical protein
MLRNSTELGNDALFNPPSRFGAAHNRPQNVRSGNSSRMSTGSGHSSSKRTSTQHGSSHQAWPSVSSAGRRRSINSNISNLTVPHHLDTLPPNLANLSDSGMLPPAPYFRDGAGRSYSLTTASQSSMGLTNYRSLTSLRSHEPIQRPRSPYKYPTRLKRPGYRPSSPALSDMTGLSLSRAQHTRLGSGLRMAHGPNMQLGQSMIPITRPAPLYSTGRNRSTHSVASLGGYENMPGAFPAPHRVTLSNYENYTPGMMPDTIPGPRCRTPSIPDLPSPAMSSGGYSVSRGTPATDPMTPGQYPGLLMSDHSSSDPGSSAPPTPCDLPSVSSTEPSVVPSAPLPLRVSAPATATAPLYYDYSEHFDSVDKDVAQIYYETTSTPIPFGFVQRIKTILEERAIIERNAESLHTPTMSVIELPDNEIHELPATPVIRRITRELILANLDPSSDIRDSTTATVNQILEGIAQPNDALMETTSASKSPVELTTIEHDRHRSTSKHLANGPLSTSNNPAIEHSLDCSILRSNMTLESGLDIYLSADRTDELVLSVHDEPTEPVTIATAGVEVTSPTPTHPVQSPWTPKFQHPIDPNRAQSAFLTSSIYSSSHRDIASRFSTPTVSFDWLLKEEGESSGHSNSSHGHRCSDMSYTQCLSNNNRTQRPPEANQSQCPSEPSYNQRHSSINHIRRTSDTNHVHHLSEDPHDHGSSNSKHTLMPSIAPSTVQNIPKASHNRPNSNPLPPTGKHDDRKSFTCPTIKIPTAVYSATEPMMHPSSYFNSPISNIGDYKSRALLQQHQSPLSPLLAESSRPESTNLSSVWSYRKPVPKRTSSPVNASARSSIKNYEPAKDRDSLGGEPLSNCTSPTDQIVDNKMADLRFSALRSLVRQLDDVKEEPSLEHSCVDLRSSNFKFPLPQRKSLLAHFEGIRRSKEIKGDSNRRDSGREFELRPRSRALSERQLAKEPLFRPPSGAMTLADMRAIPSLNFSRQDLFSKLNDALGLRRTISCDEFPQLVAPSPSRPLSSNLMREKYRSFFQTLDGMTCDRIPDINVDDETQRPTLENEIMPQRDSFPFSSRLRPMSTDELIAELERISVPSLNGLTHRLSELLPSLKRYYGDGKEVNYEDETVRSAIEEIRKLGQLAKVTSEDDFNIAGENPFEKSMVAEGLSHSPGESLSGSTGNLPAGRPRSATSPGLSRDAPVPLAAELEAPSAAVLRSRSLSDGINFSCISGYSSLSKLARISDRSLRGSPASRPWNVDANYPWADSAPSIDISLPAPTLRRDVIKQMPSKLRLRISRGSGSDTDDLGTELGSVTVPGDPTDSTGATTDTFGLNHKRKTSKRSILGSLTRKIGLGNSFDQCGFATSREILGGEDRTVDPGDRYPTTGLSPPSALNIDEVRSFFSDDSSAHGDAAIRGVSFRKRLTNFRTRLPPIARAHSALEHRCALQGADLRRSNSLFVAKAGARSTVAGSAVAHGDGVVGMPKTEFRAKKLVDRMKTLWYKGGELLRTLSGKKKNEGHQAHDWEDSGESANWSNV